MKIQRFTTGTMLLKDITQTFVLNICFALNSIPCIGKVLQASGYS